MLPWDKQADTTSVASSVLLPQPENSGDGINLCLGFTPDTYAVLVSSALS